MKVFTKTDILNDLDEIAVYKSFLDLEHGYFHTAGSRINLFADEDRWAIVFEKSGYANRGGRAELELNYYGNCLINLDSAGHEQQYTSNTKWFSLINGDELQKIETDFELVAKEAKTVLVRDKSFAIEHDPLKYKARGIDIQDFDNPQQLIDFPSLIRYLDEANPEALRATTDELRTCLPLDLPFLMKIDHWHHKSYWNGDGLKPSSYETFQLIADVLVNRSPSYWQPSLPANNDWRNWPEAGGL